MITASDQSVPEVVCRSTGCVQQCVNANVIVAVIVVIAAVIIYSCTAFTI